LLNEMARKRPVEVQVNPARVPYLLNHPGDADAWP
jgi:hypothetical protein